MSYADSLLTPDERVVVRKRQHWTALVLDSWLAIILWAITIAVFVVGIFLPDEVFGANLFGEGTWFSTAWTSIGLITLLLGIIVVFLRYWWWRTQEFLVTNRRLVLAWGVLNKSSSDSSLEKINDAQLEISLLGRLLDYGSMKVLTAAPLQGADLLERLDDAKAFKKAMMTAKHDLIMGDGGDGEGYASRAAGDSGVRTPVTPTPIPATPATPATEETTTPAAPTIDVSGGEDPMKADTPDEVAAVLERLGALRDQGVLSEEDYEAKKQELLGRL